MQPSGISLCEAVWEVNLLLGSGNGDSLIGPLVWGVAEAIGRAIDQPEDRFGRTRKAGF